MWADEVAAPPAALGLGADVASRTYRLTGIGESQVAELLGEALLRATEPDRRDLRPGRGGRRPDLGASGDGDRDRPRSSSRRPRRDRRASGSASYVWATGETTWSEAIGERARRARLDAGRRRDRDGRAARRAVRRRRLAPLRRVARAPMPPAATAHGATADDELDGRRSDRGPRRSTLGRTRGARRELGGSEVGLALRATPRGRRHRGLGRGRDARRRAGAAPAGVPRRRQRPEPRGAGGGGDPARDAARAPADGDLGRRRPSGATPGASPSRSVTTITSRSSRIAVVGELAEQLVHALAGAADHRRQVALGQRSSRAGSPRPARRAAVGRRGATRHAARRPVMSRKWSSSTCVGQPPQLAGERCQQGVADRRLGRRSARGTGRAAGRRSRSRSSAVARRRARRAVEQRQLAEDVAGAQGARMASSPVSDGSEILTSPLTMMNRASPGSPGWKMTSPRRNRRARVPAATRSRAAGIEAGEERDRRERVDDRGRRASMARPS